MTYEHVLTYDWVKYFGFSEGTKVSSLTKDITMIKHEFTYQRDYEQATVSAKAAYALPYEFIS